MTIRELEIFKLIEQNPMISQVDIGKILNITRSSVAVHISNLTKKGYIKGKGYITNDNNPITVIGGANVDIHGIPYNSLVMQDSNPGTIKTSLGGVGRNIAENLSKLNLDVRLIFAIGNDSDGDVICENAKNNNINTDDCLCLENERTSTYLYVINENGEMIVAINDMEITKKIDSNFLKRKISKIDKSPFTVIDANLPSASIQYLANNLKESKLILDTVSTSKALRAKEVLHKFFGIKLNKLEAEALLECNLTSENDIKLAGDRFKNMGITHVIITLGVEGVYYSGDEVSFFREAINVKPVNVTGAGDAFTAAFVYGLYNNYNPQDLVDFCIGASTVAILSEETIESNFSIEKVNNILKENKKNEFICSCK